MSETLLDESFAETAARSATPRRRRRILTAAACAGLVAGLCVLAACLGDSGLATNLPARKTPPCFAHPFGTDWLGRDMFTRVVLGLRVSLGVGLAAAGSSAVISLILGAAAGIWGGKADALVNGAVDLVMSMPHLVLLILVSFALGGGRQGVIIAVAVSHWPRLARIIRAEVMQLKHSDFVAVSKALGRGRAFIAARHMPPHVLPQFAVGLLLLFPHAIMHAAGLTFLGFGLSPHDPSIGVLLAESMRHLSTGYWWLAVIPGLALVCLVMVFDQLGASLRVLLDPKTRQE